jgi:hypothetical protein
MERFAKAVERRLEPGTRPKDLQDLLPMEAVIGTRGQELGEGLGTAPLPVRDGLRDSRSLDSKTSQELDAKRSHGSLVEPVPIRAGEKAQSGRPQSRVDGHLTACFGRRPFGVPFPFTSRATSSMSSAAADTSCARSSSSE